MKHIEIVCFPARVFRWFKTYSEGTESIKDDPHSGRPLTEKIDENIIRVRDLVHLSLVMVRMIG